MITNNPAMRYAIAGFLCEILLDLRMIFDELTWICKSK